MNNIKKVFFIESPLQFLCSLDYIDKESTLIIRPTSKSTSEQLHKIIERFQNSFHYEKILFLDESWTMKKYFIFLIYFYYLLIHIRKKRFFGFALAKVFKVNSLFTQCKNTVLVDDGVATLDLDNYVNGMCKKNLSVITVFHKFLSVEINSQMNYLKRVKEFHVLYSPNFQHEIKVFAGSKAYEVGLISESGYLSLLKKAMKELDVDTYIPHRDESGRLFQAIKKMGLEIITINYPIELNNFLSNKNITVLVSPFSSCLFFFKIMFDINVYFVNSLSLLEKNRVKIKNIYDVYREFGIKEIR